MKHNDLEELLYKDLLQIGFRFYRAALDERGPGAVVIDAGGRVHRPEQWLRTSRQMARLGPVEAHRARHGLPGKKNLHPLDAEMNRFIRIVCDVWLHT